MTTSTGVGAPRRAALHLLVAVGLLCSGLALVAAVEATTSPAHAAATPPPIPPLEPGVDSQQAVATTRGAEVTFSFPVQDTKNTKGEDVGLGGPYACGELGCIYYGIAWDTTGFPVVSGCTSIVWTCTVKYPSTVGEYPYWSRVRAVFGRGQTILRVQDLLVWAPSSIFFLRARPVISGTPVNADYVSAYAVRAGSPTPADCASTEWWRGHESDVTPPTPKCVTMSYIQNQGAPPNVEWMGAIPAGTGPWTIYAFDWNTVPTGIIAGAFTRWAPKVVNSISTDTRVDVILKSQGPPTTIGTTTTMPGGSTTTSTTIPGGGRKPRPPVLTTTVVGDAATGRVLGTVEDAPYAVVRVDLASASGATCPRQMSGTGVTGVGSNLMQLDSQGRGAFSIPGAVAPGTYFYGTLTANGVGTSDVSQCLKVPTGTAAGLAIPPFKTLAEFVQRQSLDVADRVATAAEQSAEISALNAGASPGSYVLGLRRSTDATTNVDPTTRLYFAYFLRVPDKGGLLHWIAEKRAGRKLDAISDAFAGSTEFKSRYGPLTNRKFVNLVYTNVLGRPGDTSGVDYWTGKLDTRAKSRGQVMTGFSESPEFRSKKRAAVDVVVTWIDMLQASPDQSSYTTWAARIANDGKTVTDLANALLTDPRYVARFP
ncbi:MAG: hypothetical protein JWM05_2103 [Acidimicrobiales bacterium]|nr:hypothetical protein [Acidimicrobiales bacterium]